MKVLIIGSSNPTGEKIGKFLHSRKHIVYGADRIEQAEDVKINKFFKLDLRNKDAMKFLFQLSRPGMIVFCGNPLESKVSFVVVDYNYQIYLTMMVYAMVQNVPKIIVVSGFEGDNPSNPIEVSWYAIGLLTEIFSKAFSLHSVVIYPKDNLFKNIKKFIES